MLRQIPYVLFATIIFFVYVAYTLGVKGGDGKLLAELIIGFQFAVTLVMNMRHKFPRVWFWFWGFILCYSWFSYTRFMLGEKVASIFV